MSFTIKLKEYELAEKEREQHKASCIEAKINHITKDKYKIKIWNSGNAIAKNVIASWNETNGILFFDHEKMPFEFLEPQKGFELSFSTCFRSPRKICIKTTWEDNEGKAHSKEQWCDLKMSKRHTKKYKIKQPKKCQTCANAVECEFLKLLFQKPFDASGVLLDCKAFYTVFCKLEECCRIPHGDPEKLQQYENDYLIGKRQYLTPAMVTNGVLAAELALKALTLKEIGTFDCIHDLDKLFYALPEEHKTALSAQIKEKSHQNDATLKTNLETISNFFQDWRYFFEREAIGYSNFLPEFIHIVCDYAIADIENSVSEVSG